MKDELVVLKKNSKRCSKNKGNVGEKIKEFGK